MSVGIIDLFAGAGGWNQGLSILGRRDVVGVEWDTPACETAHAAGHARIQADVAALDPGGFADEVDWSGEGFTASPPCQSFSTAGKGRGRADADLLLAGIEQIAAGRHPRGVLARLRHHCSDPRTVLVMEPLRWALALRPGWVALEQVPPVLPLWQAYAEVLRDAGYAVATGFVHAETLGVPQTRKRAILVASLDGAVSLPAPTHSRYHSHNPRRLDSGMQQWVSMAEALLEAGLPLPGNTLRSNYGTGGDASNRGERSVDEPAPTITSKIDRNKWLVYRASNQANAGKRPLNTPAPTVNFSQRVNKVEWMDPQLAPDPQARGIQVTVTEAAVLQSFPADYPWHGTKGQQYRQLGDAVPPLLAAHVLAAVGAGTLQVDVDKAS